MRRLLCRIDELVPGQGLVTTVVTRMQSGVKLLALHRCQRLDSGWTGRATSAALLRVLAISLLSCQQLLEMCNDWAHRLSESCGWQSKDEFT